MGAASTDCLILGLAAGYHWGDVRPFLASLRRSGFAGQCILAVTPTTRDTARMAAAGCQVWPCARPAHLGHLPYNAWRFLLWRDLLATWPRRFRRILLSDVRDVVFQADPFSVAWPEGLAVCLEHQGITVGDCRHTAHWVRGHLGEATLEALADNPLSCSGTTVGSHEALLDYLEAMTRGLLPFTPAPAMAGVDQAVHNLLVHGAPGQPPLAQVHCLANGWPVLTLGHAPQPPACDGQGRVLAADGRIPLLVHQYDRFPALHAALRQGYADLGPMA